MKTIECIACKDKLGLNEFYRDKRMKLGITRRCKRCHRDFYRFAPDTTLTELKCSKCSEIKPPNAFHKYKGNRTGYYSYCKDCANAQSRKYRKRENKYHNKWYQINKERVCRERRSLSNDEYLVHLLTRDNLLNKEDITPELMALKRKQISVHRYIQNEKLNK